MLGMWAGEGDGESAKYWLSVLTGLKNRGVADIFFLVCDGLEGLPQSVGTAFPDTVLQTSSINNGWAGMVSAFTCTTTGRTCANASPSRSTCRPVRPRWLRGMNRPARAAPPVSAASAETRSRAGLAFAA